MMTCVHCTGTHDPLHCLVPPYIQERLLRARSAKVRAAAASWMAAAAEMRARREVFQLAPLLGISAGPGKGRFRRVYDARGLATLPGTPVRSEGDKASRDAAVNEAYDNSGTVYDFYQQVFGRDSLDGAGMQLVSSVHVGAPYGGALDNAFWDGRQMAYGDGDGVIFTRFTKALDVVGHELTHGVTSFTSRLAYEGQSGALNEHLSDVFGVLVRQWARKQPVAKANWLVGDAILVPRPTRRGLRDMLDPGTAYRKDPDLGDDPQPAHFRKLYTGSSDRGGVHINSGIPNRAFALAAIALGGKAWETAGPIWYALLQQLPATADFAAAARLCRQIAATHGGEAARAVDEAWKQVGL